MDANSKDWEELQDLLRNAALNDWGPNGEVVEWRDHKGKAISVDRLKDVLKAIAKLGEGQTITEKEIGEKAERPRSTVQRALRVLKAKDVLAVEGEKRAGHIRKWYRILRPKLRLLARDERLPIFQRPRATSKSHAPRPMAHASPQPGRAPQEPCAMYGGVGGDFLDSIQEEENKTLPSPPSIDSGGAWEQPVTRGELSVAHGNAEAAEQQKWWEAERALRRAGLFTARAVAEAARQDGRIRPEEIIQLASFFTSHRGAWNNDRDQEPAVIRETIRGWTPGENPTDWSVWPNTLPNYRREQHQREEQQRRRSQAVEAAAVVERDGRGQAELETEFGRELDVIITNVPMYAKLLEETPELCTPFARERLRKHGLESSSRLLLLQTLAGRKLSRTSETAGAVRPSPARPVNNPHPRHTELPPTYTDR